MLRGEPRVCVAQNAPATRRLLHCNRSTPSVAEDIAEVLRALRRAGLERVLACDLSLAHAPSNL